MAMTMKNLGRGALHCIYKRSCVLYKCQGSKWEKKLIGRRENIKEEEGMESAADCCECEEALWVWRNKGHVSGEDRLTEWKMNLFLSLQKRMWPAVWHEGYSCKFGHYSFDQQNQTTWIYWLCCLLSEPPWGLRWPQSDIKQDYKIERWGVIMGLWWRELDLPGCQLAKASTCPS